MEIIFLIFMTVVVYTSGMYTGWILGAGRAISRGMNVKT
jgi:hypothetical protein